MTVRAYGTVITARRHERGAHRPVRPSDVYRTQAL
ncbi:hypothetical protein BC793_124119 [Actinoplanes xinjiangensis]|uniref:Uncharacterized protein n=1 Tax=Actinoplanes xinjiangensis TaxID=512350 RepID=A0A316EXH2_9ACTN|nr:hypothetical protein BC793_124119 [Actinoplanes xinjiangensis]